MPAIRHVDSHPVLSGGKYAVAYEDSNGQPGVALFRSYSEANGFIATNPPPSARQMFEASIRSQS